MAVIGLPSTALRKVWHITWRYSAAEWYSDGFLKIIYTWLMTPMKLKCLLNMFLKWNITVIFRLTAMHLPFSDRVYCSLPFYPLFLWFRFWMWLRHTSDDNIAQTPNFCFFNLFVVLIFSGSKGAGSFRHFKLLKNKRVSVVMTTRWSQTLKQANVASLPMFIYIYIYSFVFCRKKP